MKILLVDKNNNVLLDHTGWTDDVIHHSNVSMAMNEDWIVIQIKDYQVAEGIKVWVDKNSWGLKYID